MLPNIKQRKRRRGTNVEGKNRKKAAEIFNASVYHYTGLIEGIFGAEEARDHRLYCRFRLKNNQKRFGLIKSIGWESRGVQQITMRNQMGLKMTQYAISNQTTLTPPLVSLGLENVM